MLPLQFNDGREIPPDWIAEAVLEVVDHFGAASYETQNVEGHWRHSGVVYRDNLVKIVVDVAASLRKRTAANEPETSARANRDDALAGASGYKAISASECRLTV